MDHLQKASSFSIFTIEGNTLSVRILAALQHHDNLQSISKLWMTFDFVLQNFQDSTSASVNNIANTQMCFVCSSCSCCVPVLFWLSCWLWVIIIPTAIIPPMVSRMGQEWLNATAGMPGIIELELGRSGKNLVRQVWCPERDTRKCKHVLLTIQLTSSLFSIV